MKRLQRSGTVAAILGAVSIVVAGCSPATTASSSGLNQSNHTGTTNSAQPAGNQTLPESNRIANAAGPSNATGTGSTPGPNASSTVQSGFNRNVQSVISGIQAAPAKMQTTVEASIRGQSFGKGMDAVAFVSPTIGYLAGQGVILKTTDGGQAFQTAYRTSTDFTGLSVAKTSRTTVAAWSNHRIVVSQDSGSTWHNASLPVTSATVQQVDFVTKSEAFAVSGNNYTTGTLWRTTDGGANWSKVKVPAAPLSVSFGSAATGWIGLENGNIDETTNSGASWTRVFHPSGKYPGRPQVHAVDDYAAWAMVVGGSGMSQTSYSVFRTQDGSHWSPVLSVGTAGAGAAPDNASGAPKGPGSSPGPFLALSSNQAVVMGTCEACGMGSGQVSSTRDGGTSWTTYPTIENSMSLPTSLSFVSLSDGWVLDATVDGGSVLLHTTDGGQRWREVYPMVNPTPVEGVSFLNSSVGFGLGIPGNANAVLKSTDGGHTWYQLGTLPAQSVERPVTVDNSSIDFVSQTQGYAIGADGRVYETIDGGGTWTAVLQGSQQNPFSSITLVKGGQYGLAAGYGPTAEVTVNGGQTWRVVQFPTNADSTAQIDLYLAGLAHLSTAPTLKTLLHTETPRWLGVQSGEIASLLGQNGQSFFVTSDGGVYWRNVDFGKHYPNPTALDFVNAQDGWMITISGSLLRTTDGGQTWTHAAH